MAKMSNKITNGLGNAITEAQAKMNGNDSVEELLNTGAENIKKRKRRTKAEMEAAKKAQQENNDVVSKEQTINVARCNEDTHIIARVEWEQDKDDDNKLPSIVEIPDSILVGSFDMDTISNYLSDTIGYCHKGFEISYSRNHKSHDEFCQWELEKARLYGRNNPDFDFRNYYEPGQIVYYIRVFDKLGEKELEKLTLRTIYARSMVGCLEKGYCQCIGLGQKDLIFETQKEALDCFKTIKVSSKYKNEYDDETGKKKRKSKKSKGIDNEDANLDESTEDYNED